MRFLTFGLDAHTRHKGGMGNLFSCCHPGRKDEEPGGSEIDRLLQDSSTQTGCVVAEEETYGSTLQQPKSRGLGEETPGILGGKEQLGAVRGMTRSSSSSRSSGVSSSGSHPAEPAATSSGAQHIPAGFALAPPAYTGRSAPTGAQVGALSATASSQGGEDRGVGGLEARGYPTGPSTVRADGSAGAGAGTATLPLGHRVAGAMPRAHPNDQQRWQHQAGGGAHAGETRLSGRVGAQKYGGAAVTARGGGRFGAGVGGAGGFAGRTVARAVPAAAGTVLAKYEMKEVLGVGSTSKCYRCINRKNKKQFACKVGCLLAARSLNTEEVVRTGRCV